MGKVKDKTGQRFGRLVAIERVEDYVSPSGKRESQWLCQCDCGNLCIVRCSSLKSGQTKSCGCLRKELPSRSLEDLTGQRFGRLVVIEYLGNRKWLCQCDCGNTCVVLGTSLKSGQTKSCGCLRKQIVRDSMLTHGLTNTRIYTTWCNIKQRCYNKKSQDYDYYGNRGIKVCDKWKNDFQAFYNWAMNNGYADELTIDRIDVNGNYCPENCRWITMKEQCKNRRSNYYITHRNETHTITEWANMFNISHSVLKYRLNANWSIEKALTTPTFMKGTNNDK